MVSSTEVQKLLLDKVIQANGMLKLNTMNLQINTIKEKQNGFKFYYD